MTIRLLSALAVVTVLAVTPAAANAATPAPASAVTPSAATPAPTSPASSQVSAPVADENGIIAILIGQFTPPIGSNKGS